jgi:hypothetical protein
MGRLSSSCRASPGAAIRATRTSSAARWPSRRTAEHGGVAPPDAADTGERLERLERLEEQLRELRAELEELKKRIPQ